MAKVLASTVHLHEDEHGEPARIVFEAGTVPPDWAEALITNPDAWGSPIPPDPTPADVGGTPPAVTEGVPPRHGPGSGRAAWETYAGSVGVDVDEDMSRDDIIAAVDAAEG